MANNIPELKVDTALERLAFSYEKLIKDNKPLKNMPSVMLWGPPGVGKSQMIKQLAKELEIRTGKKVNLTDVRLILFNPIDLRGIPTFNAEKTLAVWLKPKIFDMDASNKVINILFLDEISAAPQSVQAAAYQITLDRIIGEHKLPDNCIVIAAGNRVTDKSVAYKMPRALANRLMHLEIIPEVSSWLDWAVRSGINEKVLGFISFKSDYLYEREISQDDLAFTTPRTWEMVSDVLNGISDDVSFVYPMIAGLVGKGVASEFRAWAKVYQFLPSMKEVFGGARVAVPKATDQMYALISSMICYAREHTDNMREIENSLNFAMGFPPDFGVVLIKGYTNISKEFKLKLTKSYAFTKWMDKRGALLNGII